MILKLITNIFRDIISTLPNLIFIGNYYKSSFIFYQACKLSVFLAIFFYRESFFIVSHVYTILAILVTLLIIQVIIFITILTVFIKDYLVLHQFIFYELGYKFKFVAIIHNIRHLLNPILGISKREKMEIICRLKNKLEDIKKTNNKENITNLNNNCPAHNKQLQNAQDIVDFFGDKKNREKIVQTCYKYKLEKKADVSLTDIYNYHNQLYKKKKK